MLNAQQQIRALLAEGARQVGHTVHTPAGFTEPTAYIPKVAAIAGVIGLSASELPALVEADGRIARVPLAALAAKSLKLSAAIAELSLVAQAGAVLIVRPEQDKAIPTGLEGVVALQRAASSFNTIDAATFSAVADDANVSVSSLPVMSASIDWSLSTAMAVRFELSRSDQKGLGIELLASELLFSIVLGIARAVDASLLSAIHSLPLQSFDVGAAAARGIRFAELHALVGTSGQGAAVGQDGVLRVAGVAAELTPDMTASVVGAFNRSAVAIHDDISLHVERRNTQGDLEVTVWVNLIPLVPNAGAFFNVA